MVADALEKNAHAVPAFLRHVDVRRGHLRKRGEHGYGGLEALRLSHRRRRRGLGHWGTNGAGGGRPRDGVLTLVHV